MQTDAFIDLNKGELEYLKFRIGTWTNHVPIAGLKTIVNNKDEIVTTLHFSNFTDIEFNKVKLVILTKDSNVKPKIEYANNGILFVNVSGTDVSNTFLYYLFTKLQTNKDLVYFILNIDSDLTNSLFLKHLQNKLTESNTYWLEGFEADYPTVQDWFEDDVNMSDFEDFLNNNDKELNIEWQQILM